MIELDVDQLPEGEEVIGILRDERAPLHTWVALAVSANLNSLLAYIVFEVHNCIKLWNNVKLCNFLHVGELTADVWHSMLLHLVVIKEIEGGRERKKAAFFNKIIHILMHTCLLLFSLRLSSCTTTSKARMTSLSSFLSLLEQVHCTCKSNTTV